MTRACQPHPGDRFCQLALRSDRFWQAGERLRQGEPLSDRTAPSVAKRARPSAGWLGWWRVDELQKVIARLLRLASSGEEGGRLALQNLEP